MAVGRYCTVTPEPGRCVDNTILLDPETPGGMRYVTLMEAEGYLILPEVEAMATYGMCPVDPNAP